VPKHEINRKTTVYKPKPTELSRTEFTYVKIASKKNCILRVRKYEIHYRNNKTGRSGKRTEETGRSDEQTD
jgi:hypothetical protein